MVDDVNKKLKIRKYFKGVVFKTFAEYNTTTQEEKVSLWNFDKKNKCR